MPSDIAPPRGPSRSCADERAHPAAPGTPPAASAAFAVHLVACDDCAMEAAHARALVARLRRVDATPAAPPSLRRRVLALTRRAHPSRL